MRILPQFPLRADWPTTEILRAVCDNQFDKFDPWHGLQSYMSVHDNMHENSFTFW